MMKYLISLLLVALFVAHSAFGQLPFFIENVGQIQDESTHQREDVLYQLSLGNTTLFIRSNGFSIQKAISKDEKFQINRIDYYLKGFEANSIVTKGSQEYVENYILSSGEVRAHSFSEVECIDSLNGLSIHYYSGKDGFKYDIIIHDGHPRNSVELEVKGANVDLSEDGISVESNFSQIEEKMPLVWMKDNNGQCSIDAYYQLEREGFSIQLPDYEQGEITIDPVVTYGSYYGGESNDQCWSIVTDTLGNMYAFGTTISAQNIATVGAFDETVSLYGNMFIAKLNNEGQRIWGTYYHTNMVNPREIEVDGSGNIYVAGMTGTGDNLGTTGAHQTFFGGDYNDVFIMKLDPNGFPIWSTMYGGDGNDILEEMVLVDEILYLTGSTTSSNLIATPGAAQVTKNSTGYNSNAYIAKFDTTGQLLIGTYWGGTSSDKLSGIAYYDNALYLVGAFNSWNFGTAGTFYPTKIANSDTYLTKFDLDLNQIWGTYNDGNSHVELLHKIDVNEGEIYITATVNCSAGNNAYATTGTHKEIADAGYETYIMKFDTAGTTKIWSTLFGGTSDDYPLDIHYANNNAIVLTGITRSTDQIATNDVHKDYLTYSPQPYPPYPTYLDSYVAVFDSTGHQKWGSYYGGSGDDQANESCVFEDQIILCGRTSSLSEIAFGIPHLGAAMSTYDSGFIVKFDLDRDSIYTDLDSILVDEICPKESMTIPYQIVGTFHDDNIFELYLSDEFGDFTNQVLMGTVLADTAGYFNVQIPYLTVGGNYKFKVSSTSPEVEGIPSKSFTILQDPQTNFAYQQTYNAFQFTDVSMNATSWIWDFGNADTDNIQDPLYTYANTGIYDVTLISSNGICADTSTHKVLIEAINQILEESTLNFSVFPNPTAGILNVSTNALSLEVELQDISGRMIRKYSNIKNGSQLSINDLANGVYFIVVKQDDQAVNQKIKVIKQ
ncbi:MAG: T9SS type A sorting domain-containing protein [Crocinitomicaceae bacterium]|nr:T9SS type A sorting domain-containing protein [Crocinitomicaceae bacterium]